MQRKFLTSLGLLLTLNLLIKPFWIFGIDRTVQNITGPADYGFYLELFNLSLLFNIIIDLGITNFNNRNIAQSNQLLNKHFSAIVGIKFMLSAIYVLIAFAAAIILRYDTEQLYILGWLVVNQVLASFILYMRSNISGLMMFRTESIMSVLDRVLMIIICGVLLWGNIFSTPFRIEWFIYSQTAAYALTLVVATIIVIRKAKFRRLALKRPFFLLILKRSLPFALLFLLMTFYNRLDPIMIGRLLPKETGHIQNGYYASAFRILDAANNISYLFAVLLLPVFSRMIKQKDSVVRMVRMSFTIIITVSLIVVAGSIFYSREIMVLLYPEHGLESTRIFQLLIGGFIAVSTSYIFGTLLTANGNLRQMNLISLAGLTINFLLNFILIPRLLAEGSAWASLITQFVIAILQVAVVQYIFRFSINYRYLSTLLLFIPGVIVISFITRILPFHEWGIGSRDHSWLLNLTAMVLFSFALAGLLKLWNIRSLISILRDNR